MAGDPGQGCQAAVITVSDRCSRGEREDASGPALAELLEAAGYDVVAREVVPDEQAQIERVPVSYTHLTLPTNREV